MFTKNSKEIKMIYCAKKNQHIKETNVKREEPTYKGKVRSGQVRSGEVR